MKINLTHFAMVLAMSLGASTADAAALPTYPMSGTENPQTYTFTAAATADIVAYFAGSTAGYTENLGLRINGVATGITGLVNHASAYGASLVLGSAKAGDSLVFYTNILTTGDTFYSDKSLNTDGVNHVYSASFAGDNIIPAGTYLAFEDLRGGGDRNYHDETFVFTNVAGGVPEPASWALLIVGFGLVGVTARRSQARVAA